MNSMYIMNRSDSNVHNVYFHLYIFIYLLQRYILIKMEASGLKTLNYFLTEEKDMKINRDLTSMRPAVTIDSIVTNIVKVRFNLLGQNEKK